MVPRFSRTTLDALEAWDTARRAAEGPSRSYAADAALWSESATTFRALCTALDADHGRRVRAAEDETRRDADRQPQPHRHAAGGPL